jgi:hypothetical protein
MRRTFSLIALILCWLAIGLTSARAETAVVLVSGKASTKDRAIVAAAVRSAARSGGWHLVEAPLTEAEVTTIFGCLKAPQRWACASQVLSRKNIQRLIVATLDPEADATGGGLSLTQQVLLPGPDVASSDQRSCAKCNEERLTRVAFDLTKELVEEAAAGTGRTRIRVVSTPPGAWITIDTTNVGLTDHTSSTFPGQHVVTVQRDGYQTETRTVNVVEDRETIVAITLRPNRGPAPRLDPVGHRSFLPEISMVAVGSAAIVGGLIALAFNQQDDGKPATEKQPRFYYDTVPAGITAIIGGGALGAVGGYLWWKHARHDAKPVRSAPTVTPVAGGAMVGVHGVF